MKQLRTRRINIRMGSSHFDRRTFLKIASAIGGVSLVPPSIVRALAIPPTRRTDSIQDVDHVVILMQENRSFDHYFGTLRGVRGFRDPRVLTSQDGRSIWHQPVATTKSKDYKARGVAQDATHVLPFYLNPQRTTEHQDGTDHGWSSGHQAWNGGHWNRWVNAKQDPLTMGYLRRQDVQFHYALADAFTICDAYHCSIHANTAPNRIYMWTGTIDSENRLGRKANGPGLEERAKENGYTWTTYPERLQRAGVTWKVYQGGTGDPGSPTDNYTDNSLEFFAQYQVAEGADHHGPLVRQGVSNHTLRDLRRDVVSGRLPQVSWIVAPYKYCEHPEASPTDGAFFISRVLDALTASPEVWSKTALLINYDENDGLFDHVVPPMPPLVTGPNATGMASTHLIPYLSQDFLDLDRFPGETRSNVPGDEMRGRQPIGLGPRVPMLAISSWSTGGFVCSETFDHTSVLRFLEARFGIEEPNISPWRRSMCGDLTSAFDFKTPTNPVRFAFFTEPPRAIESEHAPFLVPADQQMPEVEPGTRPARPVPYAFHVDCAIETASSPQTENPQPSASIKLSFVNEGAAGAAFYVYQNNASDEPRRYAVVAGDTVTDLWTISTDSPRYHLSVHGPNGSLHEYKGDASKPPQVPSVTLRWDAAAQHCALTVLAPEGTPTFTMRIRDHYATTDHNVITRTVRAGERLTLPHDASPAHGWYDLAVTLDGDNTFLRRFAGHIENGKPSFSDPGPITVYS
jgi:phospholipase C